MAGTDPWTGARLGDDNDAPLGGTQIARAVTDLRLFTVPHFATVADRDTAISALQVAGITIHSGMSCYTFDTQCYWDRSGSTWVQRINGLSNAATTNYVDARVNLPSLGWAYAVYEHGWSTYNTFGEPAARYRKLANGQVEVQGSIKGGTIGSGTWAFTLPVGYRPGALLKTPQLGNDVLARVDYRPDGTVAVIIGSSAVYTTVHCTFYAEG